MADKLKCDERLRHIAFIMDGNGRWAQNRLMPREYGHKVGTEVFERVLWHCKDLGIKYVTVYAFSTENWKRSEKEVSAIMKLLSEYIDKASKAFKDNKVRVRFIGDLSKISSDLAEKAKELEMLTEDYEQTVNIALNYGGRDEIVYAVNKLIGEGRTSVTEEDITESLYTAPEPMPDLIVRTGGEYRLSNFLLWQSAYAELYFTDVLWPDLKNEDVDDAVREFYKRNRRFGGVKR